MISIEKRRPSIRDTVLALHYYVNRTKRSPVPALLADFATLREDSPELEKFVSIFEKMFTQTDSSSEKLPSAMVYQFPAVANRRRAEKLL